MVQMTSSGNTNFIAGQNKKTPYNQLAAKGGSVLWSITACTPTYQQAYPATGVTVGIDLALVRRS